MLRRFVLAAACAAYALPALAIDMPQRKPGLWQMKMAFDNTKLPERMMEQCTDASSDKLMNGNYGGSGMEKCSKQDVHNSGGTMTIDSVCSFGGATTTSHAVVTGSFDSAYTVDVTSTRHGAPAPGMPAEGSTHMKIEAKWLGPCAAGQKPGDVIMGDHKFNMIELQKMQRQMQGVPRRP